MTKKKKDNGLPHGADRLLDAGECGDGMRHMVATKSGVPVAVTHMRRVEDGECLQPGDRVYYVDEDGRVVDTFSTGPGPAQVATPKYRNGWDAIFGKKDSADLN